MYQVYILYSISLDKFYIGHSNNLTERLSQHNSGFYDNAYTSIASDWEIFHSIGCHDKSIAIKIESHIKRMKYRVYINNLKIYPEISSKLIEKYS